jgi:hypothetical protein
VANDFDVAQSRSPRYPRYDLQAAIAYAKRFYDGAHRSVVDTHTAYRVMGFAGKTGASATALGAVRQYGLVEAPRGGVRISSLGLQILEPANLEEYVDALHVAANQPTVFAQLTAHFEGDLPKSDEPIRAYLIRQLGFSKKGADECISSLRETFSFLESQGVIHVPAGETVGVQPTVVEAVGQAHGQGVASAQSLSLPTHGSFSGDLVVIPLTKDCRVEMRFQGDLSERALIKLVRYVELMREEWAEG